MTFRRAFAAAALALPAVLGPNTARAAEPIKIGFSMPLTGGLASNGKAILAAYQMWEEDINAKGGLLGRPVKLVYYDDQSNPSVVPAIYAKLFDIDKIDLVFTSYGTNLAVPSMPVVIPRNYVLLGLFALAVNSEFDYPYYFSMFPAGPDAVREFSRGFFELAKEQNLQTVAIAGADSDFAKKAADGARENAAKMGFKVVYDRSYPPNTVDFAPIVRGIQASNPDFVYIASYPTETVGIARAANEIGLKTKLFGGGMVGLQYAAIKTQLGELLNRIVDYDFYVPEPTVPFKGIESFLARYQAKAPSIGADLLGYFIPPFAYANGQVLEQAVTAVGSLDQKKLGEHHQDPQLRYHRRQGRVCGKRRMEESARAVGAISERQGQRARTVQETRHPGDRLSEGFRVRTAAAAVFAGTLTGAPRRVALGLPVPGLERRRAH
jgi:branched-chain amino acid transport system substrate-binding protein